MRGRLPTRNWRIAEGVLLALAGSFTWLLVGGDKKEKNNGQYHYGTGQDYLFERCLGTDGSDL